MLENIPLTNAAKAVEKLVLELSRDLVRSGKWLGATILEEGLDVGTSSEKQHGLDRDHRLGFILEHDVGD